MYPWGNISNSLPVLLSECACLKQRRRLMVATLLLLPQWSKKNTWLQENIKRATLPDLNGAQKVWQIGQTTQYLPRRYRLSVKSWGRDQHTLEIIICRREKSISPLFIRVVEFLFHYFQKSSKILQGYFELTRSPTKVTLKVFSPHRLTLNSVKSVSSIFLNFVAQVKWTLSW